MSLHVAKCYCGSIFVCYLPYAGFPKLLGIYPAIRINNIMRK